MNGRTIKIAVGCALSAGVLAGAPMASAHHATSNIDMNKQYIYKGAVKKWMWVNPHSWLYVEVTKANGTKELWGFETGGPSMLARAGWKASSMKPGDQVTVYAAPDRHGKRNGGLQKVVLANGKVLEMSFGDGPPEPPPGAGPGGPGAPPGTAGPPRMSRPTPVEYK